MKILFLDESGDHSLGRVDPQYPVFVLGGIVVESDYSQHVLEPRVAEFQRSLFGREDLILHTADICRNKNGFERLVDSHFRQYFYESLNRLMQALDYGVIACAIRKSDHLRKYGGPMRSIRIY